MQERITSQRKRDYLIQLHVPQGDPPRNACCIGAQVVGASSNHTSG